MLKLHFLFVVLTVNLSSSLVFAAQLEQHNWQNELIAAAIARTNQQVTYSGEYRAIDYPNGDVPNNIGVCTDVVIRSYRQLGVDLQQLVHEDMRENFSLYPAIWGLTKPDPNIDHRRVPNLQMFFQRFALSLPPSNQISDYLPGDLVTWMLPGNLPHIGIVSNQKNSEDGNWLIIHNIGRGPKMEDFLFSAPITGQYRFSTPLPSPSP